MVEYLALSISGALLLLLTGSFDYYQNRLQSSIETQTSSGLDIPPVGGNDKEEPNDVHIALNPVFVGYLVSILLQIPVVLSFMGVL
jgi:hypothetical protein